MKKTIAFIRLSLLMLNLLVASNVFAWNALGHMVVANIAYQNLDSNARQKVDSLVANLHEQYKDMASFSQIAYWPDGIRAQKIETFTHWHYIDNAFSEDGTPPKNLIDTDNAVWALNTIAVIVHNAKANPYERARFLAFFTHIVGDLHQPLHTVSRQSSLHPDGDKGGNAFFVLVNNKRVNVHHLWDEGMGIFSGENTLENADGLAKDIMGRYPRNYFSQQVIADVNPEDWAQEGMRNAKQFVYNTAENQVPAPQYFAAGKQLTEQQAALAGYRLANILNKLLT